MVNDQAKTWQGHGKAWENRKMQVVDLVAFVMRCVVVTMVCSVGDVPRPRSLFYLGGG